MSNASSAERTEKATPKRLKEAREKGRLANSRDLISWLAMAGAAVMIPLVAQGLQSAVTESLLGLQTLIVTPTSSAALLEVGDQLSRLPGIVSPMLAGAVLGAVVGAMLQGGIHFKRFAPSFEHWNPISGIGRMVGKHALWEGAKALMKTAAVGGAIWIAIQGVSPLLASAGALPVQSIASVASGVLGTLLIAAIAAGLGLAAIDVAVVIRRNRRQTMMTKQETKDENKQSEGDPMIRQLRRSRQMAMSRNRMMAAIPTASVILLNPTHYAVALKYEPGKSAPRVVAKGVDAVAAVIREKASEARVPMIEDPPLARALHAECKVGQEIPEELYGAVAQVLAFVMSLQRRGAAMGTHRMTALARR